MAELDDLMIEASAIPPQPRRASNPRKRQRLTREEKQVALALVEGEVQRKRLQKPEKYPMRVQIEAYHRFEEAAGGRDEIIATLQHVPDGIIGINGIRRMLQDPDFARPSIYGLYAICQRHKISLSTVVSAFKDAKVAQLTVQSMVKLAEEAPKVVQQIGIDAQNRFDPCHVCEGKARVKKMTDTGEWMKSSEGDFVTQLCYNCRGTGKIFKDHDSASRKQFLQITGILDERRGPLVEFNQQANILKSDFLPGDGNFEKLIKAIDLISFKRDTENVIEAELIPHSQFEENPLIPEETAT